MLDRFLKRLVNWSPLRFWTYIAVAMLAAMEVVSWITSQVPPCVIHASYQTTNNSGGNECPTLHTFLIENTAVVLEKLSDPNWVTALATTAIAAFTIVLAVVSYVQAKLIRGTLELARAEFRSTHRPRMRLKHAWFTDQTAWRLNGPLEINLDWVNIGNTNARITWINYQSLILPTGQRLPQRPPYDDGVTQNTRFRTDSDLLSGITLKRPVCDGILNAQEVHDILWGSHRLYLIGTIEYWDGAGLRQTAFCRRLTYNTYPPGDLTDTGRFEIENDPDYEYED